MFSPHRVGTTIAWLARILAPVFLGAQLHSNGRACILVYRWVEMLELNQDWGSKTIMPKRDPA
jgi:hypothetical protein